tara:strand:+ start:50308 stop:51204 length:897 start_codon:yes stop_codon:yes gene_type:complete
VAKLKHYQWDKLRKWFCPEAGYVLDFTSKTFAQFFEDHFEVNIYADTFSEFGTSKWNRLRAFITTAPPHVVVELLNNLWKNRNSQRDDEIYQAFRHAESDWSTGSQEHSNWLSEFAAQEDDEFKHLIVELAELPSHTSTPHLRRLSSEWTLDTVDLDLRRALENTEKDPEAAITAASSLVESLCRSIILARGADLPKDMDISSLYKVVRDLLDLNPKKELKTSEIEGDIRSVLSGLGTVLLGIGALRTHAGTAHGRQKGFTRVDPRIARLAVNSASSLSLFLIETWGMKFPDDKLKIH